MDETRGNKATLADIARQAGVSVNTVSRALRAPQTVRPALRRQIETVAEALNYLPNRLAGGLAGGQIPVVGVVITSLFYSEFAETIDSLQAELADAGLNVMLGNSRYDNDEEARLIKAMMSWRPAAIVLVGVDHHVDVRRQIAASGTPLVEIWDYSEDPVDTVIGMDHRAIGAGQVTHLIERGYRKIAYIGAMRENDHRARKRYEGYAQAYRQQTGKSPIRVSEPIGGTPDLGEALTRRLLAEHADIEGIVTNSDIIAFGALRALHVLGRNVPDQIGVVGFGDNEASSCMTPALSSMRPSRADMGHAAARAILARIDGLSAASIEFDATLIPRRSTAGHAGSFAASPPKTNKGVRT